MEERVPQMMINGKLINLNELSAKELAKMQEELKQKRDELRRKINTMLDEK